jgi:uroporphyrin-III C-methyltransferase/precorrin-2 dehydrogenase/sirohydrochlorin ferrochelatase
MNTGFVSVVGAGPGDPDLLTVRAHQRLIAADLVLRDGLVPRALAAIATSARHCEVSRRPGDARIAPDDVVGLMADAVERGQRVVRLRAGDPFVLARGAEEVLGLIAAGIPFEIVPGLTTASAAPTVAGIPLTHRGVASGFVVISGHAPDAYAPVLTSLRPRSATVVILMGLAERARIASLMIAHGWPASTAAAVVTAASQPGERTWRGELGRLGGRQVVANTRTPGVIVIGDVVDVGAEIAGAVRARDANLAEAAEPGGATRFEEAAWQR